MWYLSCDDSALKLVEIKADDTWAQIFSTNELCHPLLEAYATSKHSIKSSQGVEGDLGDIMKHIGGKSNHLSHSSYSVHTHN